MLSIIDSQSCVDSLYGRHYIKYPLHTPLVVGSFQGRDDKDDIVVCLEELVSLDGVLRK